VSVVLSPVYSARSDSTHLRPVFISRQFLSFSYICAARLKSVNVLWTALSVQSDWIDSFDCRRRHNCMVLWCSVLCL